MKNIKLIIHKQWNGLTVQELFRTIWQVPKKYIHQLRMEKAVFINGTQVNWVKPLQTNDIMEIMITDEQLEVDFDVESNERSVDILYEDEHLLVANKPAGMTTHPNEKETDTLTHSILTYLWQSGNPGNIWHVHRLDKDTSGAILFAKHRLCHVILDRMLREREIHRVYWALADGIISNQQGTINQAIGRDRHHSTRRRVSKTGQQAITHYRVLKKFPKKQLTLIECTLDTGRTHQIRVHLSSIGHPLAGDKLYGGSSLFNRQALHARKLEFTHPFSMEKIKISAPFLDHIFNKYL